MKLFETKDGNRLEWIDAGKGLCMLMVVFFHAEAFYSVDCADTFSRWYAFVRQPFFFFLSGCVFCPDLLKFNYARKLKAILRVCLFTYFLFTGIILMPKALLHGNEFADGLLEILQGKASWFIISLGVSQIIYATVFRFIWKDRRVVPIVMLVSLAGWLALKSVYKEFLWYRVDDAIIVNFYFGIGILTRWYSDKLEKIFGFGWKCFALSTVLYLALCWCDFRFLNTARYIYTSTDYTNGGLYIIYSLIGIVMMLSLLKNVRWPKFMVTIGRNTLVYYYFNNGAVHVLGILAAKLIPDFPTGYHHTLLVWLAAVVALYFVALAIRNHIPMMIGDRKAWEERIWFKT